MQGPFIDKACLAADLLLRAIFNNPKATGRPCPQSSKHSLHPPLTDKERQHSAALMRVNHASEVCAQALYHGQSAATNSTWLKKEMQTAALEEGDHLFWCQTRLFELGSHPSYLNLLWYLGSYGIGYTAGKLGDAWSLGFLAETENQVIDHLAGHLKHLSTYDPVSHDILQQMQVDEAKHRDHAIQSGAKDLPGWAKWAMRGMSKIMVKTAYWI